MIGLFQVIGIALGPLLLVPLALALSIHAGHAGLYVAGFLTFTVIGLFTFLHVWVWRFVKLLFAGIAVALGARLGLGSCRGKCRMKPRQDQAAKDDPFVERPLEHPVAADAIWALRGLGVPRAQARAAVLAALREAGPDAPLETLIIAALREIRRT